MLSVAILAVGAGALASQSQAFGRTGLLLALALVVPTPIVVRALQGRWDPFEPVAFVALLLFVLFVLRPLADISYDDLFFIGLDTRSGFDGALLIALLGTVSLYTGYAVNLGPRLARRTRPLAGELHPGPAFAFGVSLTVLGIALFAIFLSRSGGLGELGQYLKRSADDPQLKANTSAYFYLGPTLAIPAGVVLLEANAVRPSVRLALSAVIAIGLFLALIVPRGDRTYLVLVAVAVVALPYLRSKRRPRVRSIVVSGLVSVALVNYLLANRTVTTYVGAANTSLGHALVHPDEQFKQFILGPDPAMFSVLALLYEVVPDRLPRRPGITVTSTLAAAVPGKLWTNKPSDGQVYVYRYLNPQQAALTRSGNSSSMFGSFYFDLGWPGVAFYCAILGILMRALFEWFRTNQDRAGVRLVYAVSFPLLFDLLRGGPASTLSRSAYVVLPLLLFFWFTSYQARTRCGSSRSKTC